MKKANFLLTLILFTALSCKDHSGSDTPASTETTSAPVTSTGTATTPATPTAPATTPPSPSTTYSTDAWTEQFMELVNNHRQSIGLRALILNDELSDIVRKHSQDMANGTVAFGHTGFSSRCSQSYDVLGGGNWCGENVAMGQRTPEAAFNAWMNSPGHRANIESGRATYTGFGYARSASGTYYWTQIFLQH